MKRSPEELHGIRLEMRARSALRRRGYEVSRVRTCAAVPLAGKYFCLDGQRRVIRLADESPITPPVIGRLGLAARGFDLSPGAATLDELCAFANRLAATDELIMTE